MFVQTYKYSFPKKYLRSWRRITKLANTIYNEYGSVRSERLLSRQEKNVSVMEIEFYASKKDFLRIKKTGNKDDRLTRLHGLLSKFVNPKSIIVETYESI